MDSREIVVTGELMPVELRWPTYHPYEADYEDTLIELDEMTVEIAADDDVVSRDGPIPVVRFESPAGGVAASKRTGHGLTIFPSDPRMFAWHDVTFGFRLYYRGAQSGEPISDDLSEYHVAECKLRLVEYSGGYVETTDQFLVTDRLTSLRFKRGPFGGELNAVVLPEPASKAPDQHYFVGEKLPIEACFDFDQLFASTLHADGVRIYDDDVAWNLDLAVAVLPLKTEREEFANSYEYRLSVAETSRLDEYFRHQRRIPAVLAGLLGLIFASA